MVEIALWQVVIFTPVLCALAWLHGFAIGRKMFKIDRERRMRESGDA